MTDHSDLIAELRGVLVCPSSQRDIMNRAASALSSQSLSLSEAREEIESHRGTLRFCEAEWSKERGVMIDKFVFERTRADRAEQVLRECQSALAMMIAPDAIKQTTVINAYATAVAAEAKARSALENVPAGLADATNNPASLSSLRKGAEL